MIIGILFVIMTRLLGVTMLSKELMVFVIAPIVLVLVSVIYTKKL